MKALMNLLIFLLVAVSFSSCRSTRYIPVETIKEKVEYRDRLQRDSIHVLDSIFLWARGDTVFRDRWRTEYRDRLIRDTTYIHRTDSIQISYPVERNNSWWESVKLEVGGLAIGAIIVMLFITIWLAYKNRKR